MSGMTIVEFLTARLDEAEHHAANRFTREDIHTLDCGAVDVDGVTFPCDCGVPGRILADVAAKRRIIARYEVCAAARDEGNRYEARVLDWVLRLFASVDDEHPDYQQEWKP